MLPYPGTLIRRGSTGPNVRIIQDYLNILGAAPRLAADGIFGPLTEAAVIAFQRRFSLAPDGIVGPITWAELMRRHAAATAPQTPSGVFNYTVVAGDTLWQLAGRFGTTVDAIRAQNNLTGDLIHTGQVLRIPGGTAPPTVPPTPPAPPVSSRVIVLDAGHGGSDPGSVSGTRQEKNDNLRLALAVRDILQGQGQRVVMTRSTDVFVTLAQRSAISNQSNADLFVSIHRNASTNAAANGVENYVHTSASDTEILYAFNVLDEIVGAGVQNNRGVIRANFAVLRETRAPAMLLEMGYITNARDNQLFDTHFTDYAAAIARGIIASLTGPSLPPPSITFYTVVRGDTLSGIAQRFGTTVAAITALNGLTTNSIIINQVLKIPR
ncbi:MAG: N-acetylmuramoyl-L-alanine amidase [Oscillospiraceae bacterium]|nr:N-acetylmuramoyl-L-alanine amidase [Oscillospiraceae bacterium]